jgi:hypothetical protein
MATRAKATGRLPGKADPSLVRELEDAAAAGKPATVVFRLASRSATQLVPPPRLTETTVKRVLDRVGKKIGRPPERHNVFPNLGSFVVEASPPFLRELLAQPEIQSAIPNRPREELLIRPVKRKPGPSPRGGKARPAYRRRAPR